MKMNGPGGVPLVHHAQALLTKLAVESLEGGGVSPNGDQTATPLASGVQPSDRSQPIQEPQ
jgi:hypothetical protein